MEAAQLLKKAPNPKIPRFSAGDTVNVSFRIREGERERIQVFQGVVIRLNNGKGPAASFTVRRITAGIGIERIFPIHSPLVESLEITRYGSVRRARLYYLRGLQGRAARIKELNPVQRRKVQEAAAAAMAELQEQAAMSTAEAEELVELEAEEAIIDSEGQATDEMVDTADDEAAETPSEEPAAEEQVAEDPPADEPPAEETEKD